MKFSTFLMTLFGLTIGTWLNAQITITGDGPLTFSAPGSFDVTLPAGCTATVTYEIWGGGGAGGYTNTANANTPFRGAPGGGGGGYSTGSMAISAGTYPIVVGAGGMLANGPNARQNGESSSAFGVTSGGGQGGGPSSGAAGAGGSGDIPGGAGGTREGNGTSGVGGGGGGGSGPGAGPGTNGAGAVGGDGGPPNGGDAGDDGFNGTSGTAPGGGGGGKGSGMGGLTSGDGGNGQILIVVSDYECILPVELLDFKGTTNKNQVTLNWQTANENNNKGFEVQKSLDGTRWTMLGFTAGKGTSYDLNSYTYTDKLPTQGANYYRLKQVDFDGRFEYSKTINVNYNRPDEVVSFPNPVTNQLILETKISEKVYIQIYNTIGQAVYQNTQSIENQLVIDVSKFKSGNYYLSINNAKTGVGIYQQHIIKK